MAAFSTYTYRLEEPLGDPPDYLVNSGAPNSGNGLN
jgi:hypothetical protein